MNIRSVLSKKWFNILIAFLFAFAFSITIITITYLGSKTKGFIGKYIGYDNNSEVIIDFNVFNGGKYVISDENQTNIYDCVWHNILAHPSTDEEKKYIREDGLFSTIDVRIQIDGIQIQKQFYYLNFTLTSYTNNGFVLKKV